MAVVYHLPLTKLYPHKMLYSKPYKQFVKNLHLMYKIDRVCKQGFLFHQHQTDAARGSIPLHRWTAAKLVAVAISIQQTGTD